MLRNSFAGHRNPALYFLHFLPKAFIFLFILASASPPADALPHYAFKRIGLSDGLSDITVNCIIQDSQGFIWMGTGNGLDRYDGYEFRSYFNSNGDSTSLMNNEIQTLYVDQQQRMWIGTSSGICLFHNSTETFTSYLFDGNYYSVFSILQDHRGVLWAGTVCGLYAYSDNHHKFEKVGLGRYGKSTIRSLFENTDGNLWIGTEKNGILILQRDSLTVKPLEIINKNKKERLLCNSVRSICTDRFHHYWIASYGSGLIVLNQHLRDLYHTAETDETHHLAVSLIRDPQGMIWAGTDGGGIMVFNPVTMKYTSIRSNLLNSHSLSSDAIRALYEDSGRDIWAGTFKGGLNLSNRNRIRAIRWYTRNPHEQGSISGNNVSSVFEDNRQTLWIGTDGEGLDYRPSSAEHFMPFSLKDGFNNLVLIRPAGNNNIVFGSFLNGCCIYDPVRDVRRYINNRNGLNGNYIVGYAYGNGTDYFAVNGGGINLRNRTTGTVHYIQQNGIISDSTLSNNFFHVMYQDSRNNLWIGTYFGLGRFDPKNGTILSFYDHGKAKSLKGNSVYSIVEDPGGYIWIGTDKGLSRLNVPVWENRKFTLKNIAHLTFTSYPIIRDRQGTAVYSLVCDTRGKLWMGTSEGLLCFDIQKPEFVSYPVSDGISEPVFNPSACCRNSSGNLVFGTQDGMLEFNPDSIQAASISSRGVLTGISVNYKALSPEMQRALNTHDDSTGTLPLSYKENSLMFRFVAPHYYQQGKIRYSYRLAPFDRGWITAPAGSRMANYTNIPPGIYTFYVRTAVLNGKWNSAVRLIRIRVMPPLWQRWWFIGLVLLMVFLVIFGAVRYKMRQMKLRQKKLEAMVNRKTVELLEEKRKQQIEEEKNKQLEIRQKEIESEKLRMEKELVAIRNEKLKALVHRKNIDIDKKDAELAMNIFKMTSQKKLIAKICQELGQIAEKSDAAVAAEISDLIGRLHVKNDQQPEWQKFEQYFDNVHEKFFFRLTRRFPQLSLAEKRMCAFLKMNLSSKEIAALSNITTRSVETERTRLRRKLGLQHHENLIEFIHRI